MTVKCDLILTFENDLQTVQDEPATRLGEPEAENSR